MEESNEENMCRICLQKHEMVYPLFSEQNGRSRSPSAGLRRLGVKIKIPGSKSICYKCLKELEAALNFIEKCEQSNQKLAEQLVQTAPNVNNVVKDNKLLNFEKKVGGAREDVIEERADGERDAKISNMGSDEGNILKPVTTHTCSICQKVFNRKFNFKLHLQRHSGDFDWACPACGVRVASGWLARRHCRPRPRRACPVPGCGKSYTTQYNLNTHIRAHKGERPFECSECGKKFTSKNTLGDHIRIHTGVKPYICPVCGKRFTTNKLSAHMCTHAGPPPGARQPAAGPRGGPRPARLHACRLCSNTYYHKQSLNKHTRKHHSHASGALKPHPAHTATNNNPKESDKPTDT